MTTNETGTLVLSPIEVNDCGNEAIQPDSFRFCDASGKLVQMERFEIPYSLLTKLYRLKEDFEARGEYLSMRGVIEHVMDKGLMYTRNVWTSVDTGREKRAIDKEFDGKISAILENPSAHESNDVIAILMERESKKAELRKKKAK